MKKSFIALSISLLITPPVMAENSGYDISDKPPEFKPLTNDFGITIVEEVAPDIEVTEPDFDAVEPANEVEQESESGWNTIWKAIGLGEDKAEDHEATDITHGSADEAYVPIDEVEESSHEPYEPIDEVYQSTEEIDEPTNEVYESSDESYEPVDEVYESTEEMDEPTAEIEPVKETEQEVVIRYYDDHNPEDHDHDHDDPEDLDHEHDDPRAHEKQIEAAKKNAARQYKQYKLERDEPWWQF